MTKNTHLAIMIVNSFFVIVNGLFMIVSEAPNINFFVAMFCLLGVMIAYHHWSNYDE